MREVHDTGIEYIVTVNGKPMAIITPLPKPAPIKSKTAGLLSGFANDEARAHESDLLVAQPVHQVDQLFT